MSMSENENDEGNVDVAQGDGEFRIYHRDDPDNIWIQSDTSVEDELEEVDADKTYVPGEDEECDEE